MLVSSEAFNFCSFKGLIAAMVLICFMLQAYKVYDEAAGKGIFLSALQRSLYNADTPLTARPWWTPQQTGYLTAIR